MAAALQNLSNFLKVKYIFEEFSNVSVGLSREWKGHLVSYVTTIHALVFVSEANLQDPPVRQSVSPSVTFFKNSCPDNSS